MSKYGSDALGPLHGREDDLWMRASLIAQLPLPNDTINAGGRSGGAPAPSSDAAAAAAAAAALPPAVQVCEVLGVGGPQLRATVEWQLAGQATTALNGSLPGPAEAVLGMGGLKVEPTPAAKLPDNPTQVESLHELDGHESLAPEDLREALWRRLVAAVRRRVPQGTAVLSCALVLLVGRAVAV